MSKWSNLTSLKATLQQQQQQQLQSTNKIQSAIQQKQATNLMQYVNKQQQRPHSQPNKQRSQSLSWRQPDPQQQASSFRSLMDSLALADSLLDKEIFDLTTELKQLKTVDVDESPASVIKVSTEVIAWTYNTTVCSCCLANWVKLPDDHTKALEKAYASGDKSIVTIINNGYSLVSASQYDMEKLVNESGNKIRRDKITTCNLKDAMDAAKVPQASISLEVAKKVPKSQISMGGGGGAPKYTLVDVTTQDMDVNVWFLHTMPPDTKIIKTSRVIHPKSVHLYQGFKDRMADANQETTEMLLFHASGESSDTILTNGLDMRYSIQGNSGYAIYMANKAKYSHASYSKNTFRMYVVRTIVGKVSSDGSNKRHVRAPNGFLSTTHDQNDTSIYAVYNNEQCYITHMIEYHTNN